MIVAALAHGPEAGRSDTTAGLAPPPAAASAGDLRPASPSVEPGEPRGAGLGGVGVTVRLPFEKGALVRALS